ncbi:aminotransferase class III-fold pyridoxal phosphate-dependent enzyme [Mycobacterium shigaense]|uniref:Glutamate-1-semialdehyde 2,1-aminomutase n=1 Tax=Mycobacterium shigaense TaxID=722731 RepID=A0A1Z4EN78_9MYCO|nr:aminotransferase class III-fold pyridoxal phosphate-dependent enzyme [Mycobacterium shigaense]MEA1120470.1 aminotransferase class III-fold pyridoxal phosphate-dependent enzyme [Mycobacterium shigaense]PRI14293.1 glutamate-1-semialdehyde 2,1-aminomutase [Mycobacterium shigaense]BAX94463.1 glutamate-1-semialdehyde 2,1-aminomutase [Mycobacterium shigaense]
MTAHTAATSARITRLAYSLAEAARLLLWTSVLALEYLGKPRSRRSDVRRAVLLRRFLLRMGPLYIKAGQILGTQTGLLTREASAEFRSFFSGLPPMSGAQLARTLRKAYGKPVDQVFASFDPQPIAVGSVAQVHRALRRDGRLVAVKVVKAGVAERINASCAVVSLLLAVGYRLIPPLRALDGPAHFAELRPALTDQCDMLGEAQRQQTVADNFRAHPLLRVPQAHHDLCRPRVLVMEFVEALSGERFAEIGTGRADLARRMQDVFYTMAFLHGYFHVDPHPGNVMFSDDGAIIVLDFGLIGVLSEDDKWNLGSFFYACIRKQWDLAVDRFTRAFVADPGRLGSARAEYEGQLADILRHHFESETTSWSTVGFFDDGTRLLRSYGARVTTVFSLLALGFLTGEGFISRLDPEIDIWKNGRRFTDRFSPYMSEELREHFDIEIGNRVKKSMRIKDDPGRALLAPTHLDRFALPSAYPLIVERAEGARITDIDGNTYIDLSSGYGPHILGYAPKRVVSAIADAAAAGAVNSLGNRAEIELAETIGSAFGADTRVIFSNSGTEAVQMAIRIARAYTGRQRITKFEGHYHGFSDLGLVSSWFRYSGSHTEPAPVANSAGAQQLVVDDTVVLQYGDSASLTRLAQTAHDVAAVIVEPMPSALVAYDPDFLTELRKVCDRSGVVLIFDEVVTGFRVCYGGVQHIVDVRPDLTCLGKIIGGGLACGAVVGKREIVEIAATSGDPFLDVDTRAFVGGTLSGNSVTAAAGLAVLQELLENPGIYVQLDEHTRALKDAMKTAAAKLDIPCDVKAEHSIFSIGFDYAKGKLVRDKLSGSNVKASIALAYYMRRQGVYLPELHTILLNAAHSEQDIADIAQAFSASITEMKQHGLFAA